MTPHEITWNDEARAKILDDADRVLREAVLDVAGFGAELTSDEAYEQLNSRLKTRFIDYQPGPDVRRLADAIVAGEIETGAAEAELSDVKRSITGLGE